MNVRGLPPWVGAVALMASGCGLLQVTGDADTEWEPEGEADACRVDDEVPAFIYVRRLKQLLTGMAATEKEVAAVEQNPDALQGLVDQWMQTEAFETELSEFFELALQLNLDRTSLASQITNDDSGTLMDPRLEANLRESFMRTAVSIVQEGRPFTDVAASRTWKMTTAMMSFLIEADHVPEVDDYPVEFYQDPYTRNGVDFDESTPVSVQIDNLTFYAPGLGNGDDRADDSDMSCNADPYRYTPYNRDDSRTWHELMNGLRGHDSRFQCDTFPLLFADADFSDWRDVTMVRMDEGTQPEAFDAPALRRAVELPLRSSRTGFMGAPAFLASWETNVDNDFRVHTAQTLIVGLGLVFEGLDETMPLGDEGLAEDHANPETDCYGCHKNLDPLRNYFKNEFRFPRMQAIEPEDREPLRASFSFQGYTGAPGVQDEDLSDLGVHIAAHPYFPDAWVQKACLWANSAPCDEEDPEFVRIRGEFAQSFDFGSMLTSLLTSSLITNATCAEGFDRVPTVPTISRKDAFCDMVSRRLDVPDACTNNRSGVRNLSDALPQTGWARAKVEPEQARSPSLMYAATVDALCERMAENLVDRDAKQLDSGNLESSLEVLVNDLMGLPVSDPRRIRARAILQSVVDDVAATGRNNRDQLQEAFTVACSSPFLTSTDL